MNTLPPAVRLLAVSVILQVLSFVLIFAFGLLPSTWWWMLFILALIVPSGLRLREALLGRPSSVSPGFLLLTSLFMLGAVLLRLTQNH